MFNKKDKNSYGYADSSFYDKEAGKGKNKSGTIGSKLNFAAKEAYKQLRTNLDFALIDKEGCRKVGVTSAIRGDGKSLTAVNLAYFLAGDGRKVLLLEADMRIPTISRKIHMDKTVGLSKILAEDSIEGRELKTLVNIQLPIGNDKGRLDILTAGSIPPNPQELLGSEKMKRLMEFLESKYDYIIMDLPPVTAVADPLVASRLLDGLILVVRHDHTERGALSDALRQLDFVGARVLGFVFNAADETEASYIRKRKYTSRYRTYYKGSGYGYGYYRKPDQGNGSSHSSSK